jgi:hypothetical protein
MGGASEHRYLKTLDADLVKAVTRAARRAKKSPAELVRELILDGLQEADDYRAVLAFRKKRGRTYSHAEVKKRLGLAG